MFERFTTRARRAVVVAQDEARRLNHDYISTEHILLGLLDQGDGVGGTALERLGISLDVLRQQVEEIVGQGETAPDGHIPFTPRGKKVMELALREALQLGKNYIGTEHLLLGLLREGKGVAAQVLAKSGADLDRVRQQVIQLTAEAKVEPFMAPAKTPGLFDRFTDRARRVVAEAQDEARLLNHNYIGTEHLLLGLIGEGAGVASRALEATGISIEGARHQVEEIIGRGQQPLSAHRPFTPRAKKVLELSLREALQLGQTFIGTEHVLLALVREGEGVGIHVMVKLGADLNRVRQQVIEILSKPQAAAPASRAPTPLSRFGRDLNRIAADGGLHPAVGRNQEIDRMVQVLSRRARNNPVLVGDPGVGKLAVIEGLALRIVGGHVPPALATRTLYALDPGLLPPGDGTESRLAGVLAEIDSRDDVILVTEDMDLLRGDSGGAAALARTGMQIVTTGTTAMVAQEIQRDRRLAGMLQQVVVAAPTVEATIEILRAVRDRYEVHHGVTFTEDAIGEAARLADRYLSHRSLPASAVDLIDEAGAWEATRRPPAAWTAGGDEPARVTVGADAVRQALEHLRDHRVDDLWAAPTPRDSGQDGERDPFHDAGRDVWLMS